MSRKEIVLEFDEDTNSDTYSRVLGGLQGLLVNIGTRAQVVTDFDDDGIGALLASSRSGITSEIPTHTEWEDVSRIFIY